MAILDALEIERFRGIRLGEIADLADVTVLVGRNNSGKSTIAEAIVLAAAGAAGELGIRPTNPRLQSRHFIWRLIRKEDPNKLQEIHWYRGDTKHSIKIKVKRGQDWFVHEATTQREVIHKGPGWPPSETWQGFIEGTTAFLPSMARDHAADTALWQSLILKRGDKLLTEQMKVVFGLPDLESVQQQPNGRIYLLFKDYSVPLDSQGDGARAVLRCLMTLAPLSDCVLVVEEPEVSQHPGSLDRFADSLCALASKRNVQLLLTTHSLEAVQCLSTAAEKHHRSFAVFFVELLDHGDLRARRLETDTVSSLSATGTDVRSLDLYA